MSHYAIFLFTSVHITQYHLFLVEFTVKDSVAFRWLELIKVLDSLASSDLSFGMWVIMKRGCNDYGGHVNGDCAVLQQIPQLACHCLHSSTWKLIPQSQPHWLSLEWGVCAPYLTQSENDWVPHLPVSERLSLWWPLHWRDWISVKYWLKLTSLGQLLTRLPAFPRHTLIFQMGGVICFISWQRTAFTIWCAYFLICREWHLVRVA